jgi:hypothetical protein
MSESSSPPEWRPAVTFDPQRATFYCDPVCFSVLIKETGGQPRPDAGADPDAVRMVPDELRGGALRALTESGVLDLNYRVHPELAPAVRVVQEPEVAATVTSAGDSGLQHHWLWVAGPMAVVLAQLDDTLHQIVTSGPSFAVTCLGRLIRIRPRPRIAGPLGQEVPVALDDSFMTSVLSPHVDERRNAMQWLAAATASWGEDWTTSLTEQPMWRASTIFCGRPGSDQPLDERGLFLIDSAAGIAMAQHDTERGPTLAPSDPTAVWSMLAALLPTFS